MTRSTFIFLAVISLLTACKNSEEVKPVNRFSDQKLRTIYELQDQRNTRGLIPYLKAKKVEHREAAALAFASIMDTSAFPFLKQSLLTDQKPKVRKAAAYAIGQLHDSGNVGVLFMALEAEIDPDVRKYIFEALGKSANSEVVSYFNTFESHITQFREGHAMGMYRALRQRQIGDSFVARALSYFDPTSSEEAKFYSAGVISRIPRKFTEAYRDQIHELALQQKDEEVKRLLNMALGEQTSKKQVVAWHEVLSDLGKYDEHPYDLVNVLREADLSSQSAKDSLKSWALNARYQVVRTTSAELLMNNLSDDDRRSDWFEPFLRECIASRDMALQSVSCYELTAHPKPELLEMLQAYRDSLSVPRQTETLIDFNKAIAAVNGEAITHPSADLNHRIDWEYVLTIPEDQQVKIKTSEGDIVLRLYVNEAPGSVCNFLQLVDRKFYDNKYFHRVVPHFVIQGGCPRGDGWGSLDWSQRSEFSNYLRYETGSVGLASAGKDTEGVQFFITHNPTPFLDGRYTIFGKVVSGMDVVNKISVGDKIISITKV